MSWLRDHFYTFVFPVVKNKLFGTRIPSNLGKLFLLSTPSSPTKEDAYKLPPYDPHEEYRCYEGLYADRYPTELAKLWSLCRAIGLIAPHDELTGLFPRVQREERRRQGRFHNAVVRETLRSAVSRMKREGHPKLLLAGRDVWVYEVLCRKRGIPSVYIPEISRTVAYDKPALCDLLKQQQITGDELLLDTGWLGSIQRGISDALGRKIACVMMSAVDDPNLQQVFPNRKRARGEALETEYLPKYYKTGTVRKGKAVLYIEEQAEFVDCAVMTSAIWRGLDPNHLLRRG